MSAHVVVRRRLTTTRASTPCEWINDNIPTRHRNIDSSRNFHDIFRSHERMQNLFDCPTDFDVYNHLSYFSISGILLPRICNYCVRDCAILCRQDAESVHSFLVFTILLYIIININRGCGQLAYFLPTCASIEECKRFFYCWCNSAACLQHKYIHILIFPVHESSANLCVSVQRYSDSKKQRLRRLLFAMIIGDNISSHILQVDHVWIVSEAFRCYFYCMQSCTALNKY